MFNPFEYVLKHPLAHPFAINVQMVGIDPFAAWLQAHKTPVLTHTSPLVMLPPVEVVGIPAPAAHHAAHGGM